jgi:diguanylate cyclase (GGDEF)-like protein
MNGMKILAETRQQAAELGRVYRERLNRAWDALSMRAKLSVLFSGLILVMTAFFYGFAVYQTTREIKISAIYKGQAIAEALKGEVTYGIQSKTFSNLDFTFRRLASSRNDIAYVLLLDVDGVILSNSDQEQVGQVLNDPLTLEALRSNGTRVQFRRFHHDDQGEFSDLCDVSVPIVMRGKRMATLKIGISLTQYLLANGPRIRWKIAIFVLPFACLSILIAMRLARSFTRPLQDLAQAVSEVSRGNYNVQLPLYRRDELGEVAQSFNKMAVHLKENFQKVSDMANRDGLTGLYNARFFQEALTREIEKTKRTGRPLSLVIFDADRFKRINDRFGHPIGDQILQHVSRIGRSVLRGYDVLARYGGEEFIAMLTDTTGSQAVLLAERLRKMVEQRPYVTEEGDAIKMTVSVGVAQARAPYDKKETISQADQALYRAKETGRNRIVLFKHPEVDVPSITMESPESTFKL